MHVRAATLSASPNTGVYSAGSTFTMRIVINTAGKAVNAAEGQISFNPRELSVVSVSRSSSIFNLWTQEPSFSNSAGTISFGGGSPTGYTGSNGTVLTVTFRALYAGNPKISFTGGSVLAADGLGTNVLTGMTGATYTVSAPQENPEPEYIAPPNTPDAPRVTSNTHPDPTEWYKNTTAELSWNIPSDVIGVRTLLDTSPATIPTIVYDEPITSRTLEDLEEGVSYFHIQFKNSDGWGKVTHYRLGVDSKAPEAFTITEASEEAQRGPQKTFIFAVTDTSPVKRYLIQFNGGEQIEFIDEKELGTYTAPMLPPGHHTMVVEAFDAAGNSLIATHSFDVASFDKPIFTEYPERLNNQVIPAIKGSTKPRSTVSISVTSTQGGTTDYTVQSDENGTFIFIPNTTFELGVYDITAIATDEFGAQSAPSDTIRIIVEEPGYLRIGSFVISLLSVIIPLVSLLIVSIFGTWYLFRRLLLWRRYVVKETKEAERKLATEFDGMTLHLATQVQKLKKLRKNKLTEAELEIIDDIKVGIDKARERIYKEISDIDDIVK